MEQVPSRNTFQHDYLYLFASLLLLGIDEPLVPIIQTIARLTNRGVT